MTVAASIAERRVCQHLRPALADLEPGAWIPETDNFRNALWDLERFVPEVLEDFHEVLDGIYPFTSRKAGQRGVELFGVCILISDQKLVPLQINLQLSAEQDEVSWLECRLGEQIGGEMQRTSYELLNKLAKRFWGSRWGPDTIHWCYTAIRGE